MKFKRILLLCLLSTTLLYAEPPAVFEIGAMLGEPTGLSTKYWLSDNNAVDAVAAWSFSEEVLELALDYQRHFFIFTLKDNLLPLYLGIGAGLRLGNREDSDDDTFLGARIPIGVAHIFKNAPIGLFGEIAPIVEFIPETEFRLSGGGGIRFLFGKNDIQP